MIRPSIVIAGLVVVAVGLAFLGWGWRYGTAGIKGSVEAHERIQSGNFRTYSYDHFFDLCQEIQSAQDMYASQKEGLELLEKGSSQHARAVRNVNVLRGQINRLVNTYNADARKEKTVGQFRSAGLPERINITASEYERRIPCQ